MVAVVSAVGIGVLVVMGILQRVAFPDWGLANLDSEVSVATFFSAALLVGNGLLVAARRNDGPTPVDGNLGLVGSAGMAGAR